MDIVHTDMCQYDIQEQKEVPALYTGIYRLISSTGTGLISRTLYSIAVETVYLMWV
jgi:hypothetical protein